MSLAIRDVGLTRFHAREHVDQPGAALLELGGCLGERGSTRVELPGARVEPVKARFMVAQVTRAPRQLRFLLRELRRALADSRFTGCETRSELVELFLPRSCRAFALVDGGDAGRERGLCVTEPLPLGFELRHASLELG